MCVKNNNQVYAFALFSPEDRMMSLSLCGRSSSVGSPHTQNQRNPAGTDDEGENKCSQVKLHLQSDAYNAQWHQWDRSFGYIESCLCAWTKPWEEFMYNPSAVDLQDWCFLSHVWKGLKWNQPDTLFEMPSGQFNNTISICTGSNFLSKWNNQFD